MLAIAAATIGSRAQPSPSPAFEVASVRRTPPASLGNTSVGPWGTATYTITNAGLYLLVEQAYGISEGQISGIDKLGSEHYDISAKAEEGVKLTPELLRPRLQRLLAERFKLEVHRDSKDVDGYALVVAKGGPKLKPAGKQRDETGELQHRSLEPYTIWMLPPDSIFRLATNAHESTRITHVGFVHSCAFVFIRDQTRCSCGGPPHRVTITSYARTGAALRPFLLAAIRSC
jgi:uncharacterized protein (TIGR03435 family)